MDIIVQILEVTQAEQHWYNDIFRSVMWSIGKGILWLLDGFFDIINKIWRFDFFNNAYVDKIFNASIIIASSWIILKVLIELIMNHILKNDGRSNPLQVYKGIVLAMVIMFLVLALFNFGHDVATAMTDAVINVSGMEKSEDAETSISKAIVRSLVYDDETKEDDINYLVNHWKDVDINETEGTFLGINDTYKYSLNFFMLIVLSIVTVFLLFFVAIQMAKRVMELALFKVIAPFCASSLTNDGKAFSTWAKSTMGLFLVTVVQFVSIGLMFQMFSTAFQVNGTMTGLFLVIGALLFIIGTPTIINSLLGQQSGMMSAFGDIQSLVALSGGISHGLQIANTASSTALSIGSQVINRSASSLKGMNLFSHHNSTLSKEQRDIIKNDLNMHDFYRANQDINRFNPITNNMNNPSNYIRPFNKMHNVPFNTIKGNFVKKDGDK